MSPEESLSFHNIKLPSLPEVAGLYKPMLVIGELAYLSGHLPILEGGDILTGQVGHDCSVEDGSVAARQAGLNMLTTLQTGLGSLNSVVRVVKLLGLVNAPAGFSKHPQVMNGCSQLFGDVFGEECGIGTRSALGASGLPGGAMVEIEGIFQITK